MANLTPEQIADKWAQRLSNAQTDIQNGVMNVTVAPTAKAAKNPQKYLLGVQNAVNSGKWAKSLNNVTLQQWQESMITKGLPRVSQGAQAAKSKMSNFMTRLLPYQQTLSAKVSAMPNTTLEENISRMTEWVRGMSKFTNG